MELRNSIFEKLKEESTSVIDRHNFISKIGGMNIDWDAHFTALGELTDRKLIRIEGISKPQIVLLPNFYDAVMEGGIDEWEAAKMAEKQLNSNLVNSSIQTNTISKRTSLISTFVSVVTLLVLLFHTFNPNSGPPTDIELNLKSEESKIEATTEIKIIEEYDSIQTDSIR